MDAVSHAMDQPQSDDLKETGNMWISKAHYGLLTEHVAEARSNLNERSRQFAATIFAQQAQINSLEQDRRELTRLLFDRDERRTAPVAAVPDATPPEGWEAIMHKQIEEQDVIESYD